MSDEDALAYLKDRIKAAPPDLRSRASRTPLDSAPETFMGASVGTATAASEGTGGGDGVVASEAPKRRVKRITKRSGQTTAMDPSMMSKILGGLKENPTGGRLSRPLEPDPTTEPVEPVESVSKSPDPIPRVEPSPKPTALPVLPVAAPALSSSPSTLPSSTKRTTISPASLLTKTSEEEIRRLKEELRTTKTKLDDVTEKVDHYNTLCENLLETESGDPQDLAKYISSLMEKVDEAEEMKTKQQAAHDEKLQEAQTEAETAKQQIEKARQEIAQLREDLTTAHQENEQLKSSMAAQGESDPASLQAKLQAKDEEINRLQDQLKQIQGQGGGMMATDGLTTMDQAEQDLKAMEELIREQEEYMNGLEQEMERALEGLPEGIKAEFLKEKERIMQEATATSTSRLPPSIQAIESSSQEDKTESITK